MCETVIKQIAQHVCARNHVLKNGGSAVAGYHADKIHQYIEEYLPSGSGINDGIKILLDNSSDTRIELFFYFDHIENDQYTKRTEHKIIILASLSNDFDLYVVGENYNGIQEYLYETFKQALEFNVETGA